MDLGTGVSIELDGDKCWPDLATRTTVEGTLVGIATLAGGTTEGRPSVTFRIELEDGTVVLAQTTLRLFQGAAAAFRGKYGEDR